MTMAKAKRKPKKPITAVWLLEHADAVGEYVLAIDDDLGCLDGYMALGSLKSAKAQAKHLREVHDLLSVPVRFDVALAAERKQ